MKTIRADRDRISQDPFEMVSYNIDWSLIFFKSICGRYFENIMN